MTASQPEGNRAADGPSPDGLPGGWLVRGAMLLGGFALVLGVFLLIATPTLPHERERTAAAPPATVPAVGPARNAPVPAPAAPGAAPPAATSRPAPSPATSAAPSPSPQAARRHTIQPGDTLLAIAEQYDTTVDAIRAANPGLNETALRVGAEIVIPAGR